MSPHHTTKKEKTVRLIRDRDVRATLISGLIIAAMAMIGPDRYPVAFAVVATAWVVVTTATVIHTTRRADRSPGTGAGRSHDDDDRLAKTWWT